MNCNSMKVGRRFWQAILFQFLQYSYRLLGDPIYESYARRAVESLWQSRDNVTGLFGNVMNIHSRKWVSTVSGLGKMREHMYFLAGYSKP